ncbi:hypothetical protein cyc_01452 [Cyclospora cayetanensis]|uniref:Uncharacterized protein n=1 Tax=Cyclospora cayetanensis TaxID=88456 RepID=A0A1D3CR12_9EIME|nr:hypothetical protein cyc_01452 [Cyclospora cayetanensis]
MNAGGNESSELNVYGGLQDRQGEKQQKPVEEQQHHHNEPLKGDKPTKEEQQQSHEAAPLFRQGTPEERVSLQREQQEQQKYHCHSDQRLQPEEDILQVHQETLQQGEEPLLEGDCTEPQPQEWRQRKQSHLSEQPRDLRQNIKLVQSVENKHRNSERKWQQSEIDHERQTQEQVAHDEAIEDKWETLDHPSPAQAHQQSECPQTLLKQAQREELQAEQVLQNRQPTKSLPQEFPIHQPEGEVHGKGEHEPQRHEEESKNPAAAAASSVVDADSDTLPSTEAVYKQDSAKIAALPSETVFLEPESPKNSHQQLPLTRQQRQLLGRKPLSEDFSFLMYGSGVSLELPDTWPQEHTTEVQLLTPEETQNLRQHHSPTARKAAKRQSTYRMANQSQGRKLPSKRDPPDAIAALRDRVGALENISTHDRGARRFVALNSNNSLSSSRQQSVGPAAGSCGPPGDNCSISNNTGACSEEEDQQLFGFGIDETVSFDAADGECDWYHVRGGVGFVQWLARMEVLEALRHVLQADGASCMSSSKKVEAMLILKALLPCPVPPLRTNQLQTNAFDANHADEGARFGANMRA